MLKLKLIHDVKRAPYSCKKTGLCQNKYRLPSYKDSHYIDMIFGWPAYFYNVNCYSGMIESLYRNGSEEWLRVLRVCEQGLIKCPYVCWTRTPHPPLKTQTQNKIIYIYFGCKLVKLVQLPIWLRCHKDHPCNWHINIHILALTLSIQTNIRINNSMG